MQQWFVQDTPNANVSRLVSFHDTLKSSKGNEPPLLKIFNVEAETTHGQHICVSGNCTTLGNWEVSSAFVLTNSNATRVRDK